MRKGKYQRKGRKQDKGLEEEAGHKFRVEAAEITWWGKAISLRNGSRSRENAGKGGCWKLNRISMFSVKRRDVLTVRVGDKKRGSLRKVAMLADATRKLLGKGASSQKNCWVLWKVQLRSETRDLQVQRSDKCCDFPLVTLDNLM